MALAKLDWQSVDLNSMPPAIDRQYKAYRKTVEATNKERQALEAVITTHLIKSKKVPAGMVPKFGYRFGKLAIAFAEPSQSATAGAGDQFTF